MKLGTLLRFGGIALLMIACSSQANARTESGRCEGSESCKPNVIYFMSDTHRWGAMPFTQTPAVVAPNIETLAKQGVTFSRSYSNLPVCTPYRAILMTGRWPYQQGLISNHSSLADRIDLPAGERNRGTIAWAFKDAGYNTAFVGKWHLGSKVDDLRPFGFDKSIKWPPTNPHRTGRYSVDGAPFVPWVGTSNATEQTTQALAWIDQVYEDEEPFFLVVSVNPPHPPLNDALPEKVALYPDEDTLPFHPLDTLRHFPSHQGYHAHISGLDDEIGRVMEKLDDLDLSENTILVYTSDHGGMGGVAGIGYGLKRRPHDESTRVPFLVRWPAKIPPDRQIGTPTSVVDAFPTLAGLAGLRAHLKAAGTTSAMESLKYIRSLEGNDLSRHLLGSRKARPTGPVFLMHPTNMNRLGGAPDPIFRGIVTDEFTYVWHEEGGGFALWPNTNGYQTENLIDDPSAATVRAGMKLKLAKLIRKFETPYLDNWFAEASDREISSWNREHGLGDDNVDREAGKAFVFQLPDIVRAAIDVRPGKRSNRIRLISRDGGREVRVAVLGSLAVDAEQIQPESLRFGPSSAATARTGSLKLVDVNHDGALDAVARFSISETGIAFGDAKACLSGQTAGGRDFYGCDRIRTLP